MSQAPWPASAVEVSAVADLLTSTGQAPRMPPAERASRHFGTLSGCGRLSRNRHATARQDPCGPI